MNAPLAGEPIWVELTTTDLDKAKAFYLDLLGWEFIDTGADFGHYNVISSNGQVVAGAMAKPEQAADMPNAWSVYLRTADIEETTRRVSEEGGQVIVEPIKVGDQGTMAFYSDPTGAVVGAWQPGQRKGLDATGRVGAPYWFELLTGDYDRAVEFYREVFDWDPQPMPTGEETVRYATLGAGEDARAGICDAAGWLGDQVPSHWRVYLQVDNADEAVQTVTDNGGKLLDGPMDSPFGRIATVSDDQAANFQLAQFPIDGQ